VFITADIVKEGKPFPEGYLLGRELLRVSDGKHPVVVFEDAVAGVRAGKGAGATVIAVLETHSREALSAAGADYIIEGLHAVRVAITGFGEIAIHLEG
jgi:beta-phosphoglucomutase-like phosphatase (HAD superfamily)